MSACEKVQILIHYVWAFCSSLGVLDTSVQSCVRCLFKIASWKTFTVWSKDNVTCSRGLFSKTSPFAWENSVDTSVKTHTHTHMCIHAHPYAHTHTCRASKQANKQTNKHAQPMILRWTNTITELGPARGHCALWNPQNSNPAAQWSFLRWLWPHTPSQHLQRGANWKWRALPWRPDSMNLDPAPPESNQSRLSTFFSQRFERKNVVIPFAQIDCLRNWKCTCMHMSRRILPSSTYLSYRSIYQYALKQHRHSISCGIKPCI